MNYYEVLGLKREPFSTSPDPDFFYRSTEHESALQRLEIALRLKRGLSLILGDVGTGKTTLCRTLLQSLQDDSFIFHIVLNPRYDSEFQFLHSLCRMFDVTPLYRSSLDCQEAIQRYLIQKGVEENKTVVLLIDEGQNLTTSLIEILRILLNFETNQFKLLQLVILAQLEFLPKVQRIRNFMDRISLKYIINPFGFDETKNMIRFRLEKSGYRGPGLFTDGAIESIYHHSHGYPRQITLLGHNALEYLVSKERKVVDGNLMVEVIRQTELDLPSKVAVEEDSEHP